MVIVPILLLGLMASLSPATIVVFILLLRTNRAASNAPAFLLGWALSLTVVFVASYAVGSSRTSQHGSGRTAVEVLEVLMGLALVVLAARQWRRRDEPARESAGGVSSRFAARMKELGPGGAVAVGILKQPWAITAAAAVVVVDHHSNASLSIVAFACFTVVSTATVGWIYLTFTRSPERAQAELAALQERVTAAGPALVAVAALVVGLLLTYDGITGLAGIGALWDKGG